MPQLDPATFASQVFWLIVTFVVMAFILWRIALPRISATLEGRQQRIDNDIARAEELAAEAEDVLAAYEAELAKARSGAQEQLHLAAVAASAEAEKRNAAMTEKLSADAAAANRRIDEARSAATTNVAEMVEDIAQQAVERLVGTSPDSTTVKGAVAAAVGERH
jgi:F-type H+-transporting ATPase subunit b